MTEAREFWCFDHLPKTLRRAIAEAPRKYCAAQAYELWKAKEFSCRELINLIREAD